MSNLATETNFKDLSKKNMLAVLQNVLASGYEFSIIANLDTISFEPTLPNEISKLFHNPIRFDLANYTLSSAYIEDWVLNFEAGFGTEPIGANVSIPIVGIYEIMIDNKSIIENFANYDEEIANIKRAKLFNKS